MSVTETNLSSLPELAIQDTTLCPAKQIVLSLPNSPAIHYQWQDGTTLSTYTISQAGLYSVTATAGSCTVTDTFRVAQEVSFRLPADTTLCRGATFLIAPVSSAANNLHWSDGSQGPALSVSQEGIYWARSASPGCQQMDSVRVKMVDCPGTIPNVFTPDKDGINDTFSIPGITLTPWRLEIYNRWGSPVYQSDTYKNDWSGEGLPTGVYYYLLSSSVLQKQYKGWVQIMR
ncbi:gliding motility-associated C-terminal domain-containing protein [Spirosoma areae]